MHARTHYYYYYYYYYYHYYHYCKYLAGTDDPHMPTLHLQPSAIYSPYGTPT